MVVGAGQRVAVRHCKPDAMQSTKGVLLLILFNLALLHGQKVRPAPNLPNPIEKIKAQDNFDLRQFTGKWYLLGVASECNYLKEHSHQAEATAIVLSQQASQKTLAVSTFRKLDGICWEIKQEYQTLKDQGKFLLKGHGYGNRIDIVVGKTDYRNYAIIYYQKQRKLTLKLYGRNLNVGENVFKQFEQYVIDQNISEDFIYYFPKYGFCESADEFHILTEN